MPIGFFFYANIQVQCVLFIVLFVKKKEEKTSRAFLNYSFYGSKKTISRGLVYTRTILFRSAVAYVVVNHYCNNLRRRRIVYRARPRTIRRN